MQLALTMFKLEIYISLMVHLSFQISYHTLFFTANCFKTQYSAQNKL